MVLTSCGIQKIPLNELHTLEPVEIYQTTDDFKNNKPMAVNFGILVRDKSEQHITIKGIFDLKTGAKVKQGISAWAIGYNNVHYFNLGYSNDVNNWNSYAKFDIEGRYCAIIIDDNSPNVLKSTSNMMYGGGLAGALIAESSKWGKIGKIKMAIKKEFYS